MQHASFLLTISAVTLFGGPCPATARMLRFPGQMQHLSNDPAAIAHQAISYPSFEAGVNALLYSVLGFAGLALSVLLLSCLCDAAKQWRHRSHFRACKKKVQRVHEVLEKSSGDLPICPCCVEVVSSKASRSAVVFLCGHRFHIECANRWMREHGSPMGPGDNTCPLCESFETTDPSGALEDAEKVVPEDPGGGSLGQPDEFKSFILSSLSKEYPDIIQEQCVRRWSQCHTELWLSELRCPQYNSIFQPKRLS